MTTFTAPTGPPPLLTHLLGLIQHTANNAPRSQQTQVGPSELGMLCERRLALKMLGADEVNTTADRWPSTIGTAVHTWLSNALLTDNDQLEAAGQPPRWLVEQKVTIRPGLTGSCDAYDLYTHTVIDWKVVGTTSLKKYRRAGPGQQYRTQAHLYGKGWANLGLPVKDVALVFLPRAGMLPDTHFWSEPYNPAVADDAVGRMDDLLAAMNDADHENNLEDFMAGLPRDTSMCGFCPFYSPNSATPSRSCRGALEGKP